MSPQPRPLDMACYDDPEEAPRVQGGQGRTGDEVAGYAVLVGAAVVVGALLFVLALFALGLYALRGAL